MSIAENLTSVRERIARAAERVARDPNAITLCAVSKKKSLSDLQLAYDAGQRDFGENYVQEALGKTENMPSDTRFHLTGALQRNKVKFAVGTFCLIQTVDRASLVDSLARVAKERSVVQDVLLQVNIARDEAKSGVLPEEASELCGMILQHKALALKGLMTIRLGRPWTRREAASRGVFGACPYSGRITARVRRELPELSMGMSSDFEWAIEEGATIVRVGTSIFGARA